MTTENKCARCGGETADGFIIDHGHYQTKQQQVWVEGEPESSFWSGLKTSGRETFAVRTLRCSACGYLEFYATESQHLGIFS